MKLDRKKISENLSKKKKIKKKKATLSEHFQNLTENKNVEIVKMVISNTCTAIPNTCTIILIG